MADDEITPDSRPFAPGCIAAEKGVCHGIEIGAREWIKFKKPYIRASTWSVYEGHTRNFSHDFNHLKIKRITTARVEEWILIRQDEDMNISTLRKVLVSLGQIFKYTVRHGYMDYNPLLAERPKARNRSFKKAARILSIKEIGAFLDAIDIPKYKTLFMLTIASGARQGELLGLRWSDVDWENSQIHIQRSYNNQNCYDPKNSRQTEELI